LTDLRSAPTDSPHILLIGGAGYIGSHMLLRLAQARWRATTLDDLSSGHASAVHWGTLIAGDVGDAALLDRLFAAHRFDAVMHFAARIEVAASLAHPLEYYRNNVQATLTLLEAMRRHGVSRLVFSSTAATFGQPLRSPIDESHPQAPINPYGQSKRMVEQILADCDRAYGLRSICLRYFNAAGADPLGRIGECHQPETHLIPLVLQAASGRRAHIAVHGADYDTPDGTCIRDYVHVSDLCQAHWVAEVIAAAQQVSGRTIAVQGGPRRPGDPARLVADARLARQALGWQPRHSDLHTLMAHAWQWEQTLVARTSMAPRAHPGRSPAEPAPYSAR
jgi:UDP-glucose 4-epimerase